ncbi:hypothetical protein [Fusibacter sp. 3D3]|uniref:hypothetical protein n=1 Tax=Fusibacter sp. 3D3 TaxID=1048380 RepID=UPI000852B90C|nr:hypothetical protein [Fusibacter sp. 3D3]GAU76484.1 hypothetical protein F3D3_1081 [Fusibacter sp. 3D3]
MWAFFHFTKKQQPLTTFHYQFTHNAYFRTSKNATEFYTDGESTQNPSNDDPNRFARDAVIVISVGGAVACSAGPLGAGVVTSILCGETECSTLLTKNVFVKILILRTPIGHTKL